MVRKAKTEDQKTWEIMSQFWAGHVYNRHGQRVASPMQQKRRAEYANHTAKLEELAARGLVVFINENHWEWTKAGVEWCDTYLATLKSEN